MVSQNIRLLRTEFREFCVECLVLRKIHDIFLNTGFTQEKIDHHFGGERRMLVEEYYASADWDDSETIKRFLETLEQVLRASFVSDPCKDALRSLCTEHGFEVDESGFSIYLTTLGVGEVVKNIIFAANGPKPEIVLSDSVSNRIEIVRNAEYCLVYDHPLRPQGLLWSELVEWWGETMHRPVSREVETTLYRRLEESLGSEAERSLWFTYFKLFHDRLGEAFPALLPQVYLHYDPYTIKQLGGRGRLPRQRMDFLILLSNRTRIVIEVDGKQHYSLDNGQASPRMYSEMVAEDRNIKLNGYEIYRFGGYELTQPDNEGLIGNFFERLFDKHGVAGKE
ncbi:MAG TPA: hypothetical protein VLL52_25970 [Anaerolineae bacterium]|nr:hypothetical protein [Anaerolineae bacterium]